MQCTLRHCVEATWGVDRAGCLQRRPSLGGLVGGEDERCKTCLTWYQVWLVSRLSMVGAWCHALHLSLHAFGLADSIQRAVRWLRENPPPPSLPSFPHAGPSSNRMHWHCAALQLHQSSFLLNVVYIILHKTSFP